MGDTMDTPRRAPAGFTLIEVLIALVVAVMLCAAIAAGLMLVLRQEVRSADAQDLALAVHAVSAARTLDPGAERATPPLIGLTVDRSLVEEGTGDGKRAWDQWSVYHPERPSQRLRLLFPTNLTDQTHRLGDER
ncbi:MAG: hypothetical protein BWK77_02840 [Verrucomicrobia bacterium A1]|nr:MAG: hypothetical protein BWK77_02840 [Verrucomicrobia bacterium A1]